MVLRSSTHTEKGPFYRYLKPWLGEGVFISEGTQLTLTSQKLHGIISGAKWFLQRKLLTSTFHFKILEEFLETFGEKAKLLVKDLGLKADGNYFSILPRLHVSTLDVICGTFSIFFKDLANTAFFPRNFNGSSSK